MVPQRTGAAPAALHGIDPARKAQVRRLLEAQDWPALRELLADWWPEVAELLPQMGKPERVLLFRALPRPLAAEVFAHLDPGDQDALLRDLTDQEAREVLARMSPDDRTALLSELPAEVTRRLLGLLGPEDLREARQLLGYPEESVGRLMTPDYVAVHPSWSVGEALDHVRRHGKDSETVHIVYITDGAGRLLDDMPLRRLILADPGASVESLRDHSFTALRAFEDREAAVRAMQRTDAYALPVVDSEGVLLGIVTIDDVLDVAQAEATEDIQKGASVEPLGVPYTRASSWVLYRKRVGWLAALVLVSLVSSGVIAAYEGMLAGAIGLAFFIPLLIGTGGNAGSQSAMLAVRAIATGDLDARRGARVLAREVGVGVLLGATLGLASWGLGVVRAGPEIGLVVGLAMGAIVLIASLVGAALPLLLTRFGQDPAVASSPLVTSIMDALGLLVYFGLATALLTSL